MGLLRQFQETAIQAVLQKIDRKSKPIKKQIKIVNKNLLKKGILLEDENFNIYQFLKNNNDKENSDELKLDDG